MTAASFGEEVGVHPGTLLAWCSRLRREDPCEGGSARFVELVTGKADAPAARTLVAEPRAGGPALGEAAWGCRVRVGATVVELAERPPAAWLSELLGRC